MSPAVDVGGAKTATVTSTSPLRITYDGQAAQLAAKATAGYSPALGDRVAVIALDVSKRLILGPVVSMVASGKVLVPGDDGSIWQVKATSSGTLYATKVS